MKWQCFSVKEFNVKLNGKKEVLFVIKTETGSERLLWRY